MAVIDIPRLGENRSKQDSQAGDMRSAYGAAMRLMEAIGRAAREAREQAGLNQSRLAAALNEAGADQGTISRFEKGKVRKDGRVVIVQPRDLEKTLLAYEVETGRSVTAILRAACELYEASPPTPEELAEDLEDALGPAVQENGQLRNDPEEGPRAIEN